MNEKERHWNYERIAQAIVYIKDNFDRQPSLEDIAAHIHLSPFHCQRLFHEWAGTTPKKFLQYISLSHAKSLLQKSESISETTFKTGLSSSSRLHELFVKLEGMTPHEYRNKGEGLVITYDYADTSFGEIIIAATEKGICHIAFVTDRDSGVKSLIDLFPHASFKESASPFHQQVRDFMNGEKDAKDPIKLHVKGTAFQLKVWEALLQIPLGELETYGRIAEHIGNPKASRAVGTAIGSNPIAYLIPCHRVIQASGVIGGYMWGPTRKTAIIGWENAQVTP
ncbi:bifunctional transcriptional activator/DNA repair enzyme AdaA [Sphingobacterium yanglingense]|uniref:methylated-DNA--[protein]-cysteine S-methyltransferase n=1 Tax=Sphingobacterium yanglingense TaxID=1437280 RepID=A0A4R6WKN5_9SPHI|nr:methylated-DNA--[protein]-cysteine S-methyltransferase [Sphingobacterium yanglingense]TDQ81242.1 AraC family transcriptional regulator of adaptative response/methylated-DNA-[protein]-cysteine methyltransferase [Sphingobacterium yanglingense]